MRPVQTFLHYRGTRQRAYLSRGSPVPRSMRTNQASVAKAEAERRKKDRAVPDETVSDNRWMADLVDWDLYEKEATYMWLVSNLNEVLAQAADKLEASGLDRQAVDAGLRNLAASLLPDPAPHRAKLADDLRTRERILADG